MVPSISLLLVILLLTLLHSNLIQSFTIMVVGDFSLKGKIAVVTGGGSGMFLLSSRHLQH
jgi:hypothetical protein